MSERTPGVTTETELRQLLREALEIVGEVDIRDDDLAWINRRLNWIARAREAVKP